MRASCDVDLRRRAAPRRHFHCCGGESVDRWRLAELTADAFGFDARLVTPGRPDGALVPAAAIPYDTSLTANATAESLDVALPSVRDMLEGLRHELETGSLAAA